MFLYAVRYQSWFLPKIRCKCLRFFVAKIQKPMEKPILLVAFDTSLEEQSDEDMAKKR